jgi:hypothetical protein
MSKRSLAATVFFQPLMAIIALGQPCIPSNQAPVGAVRVDAAWLAARGNPPWFLDQDNKTYFLENDVTTPSSAFVIGGQNIIFDLNCRKIVYGNGRSPNVANGDFENEIASNASWVHSGPGRVGRRQAPVGMWGQWALEISGLGSGQTQLIESQSITIPEANREYVAAVTPKGPSTAKVKIRVIDASNRSVLAEGTSSAVNRGFAATTVYTANNSNSVRIQIEIIGPGSVLLDRASLIRSRDFGIIATPSTWNLPSPLKSDPRVVAAGRKVKSFQLKRAQIQQGSGASSSGSGIYAAWLKGLNIENSRFSTTGEDTHVVDALGVAGFLAKNLQIAAIPSRITNRMALYSGINLQRAHGIIKIEDSEFNGLPQCGVVVARQAPSDIPSGEHQELRIANNRFNLNAIASDPYAIVIVGVNNFVIANNTARSANGRGLLLDGWGDLAIEDGEVRDNEFHAYERPNLEYDARGIDATALRIRNWVGEGQKPNKGAIRRVRFIRNKFIAKTDTTGAQGAIGARLSFRNNDGRMNSSGVRFEKNMFRATTTDAAKFAYGISFSGVYSGVAVSYADDVVESNHIAIQFGDNDSYREREEDIVLSRSILKKIAPLNGISFLPYAKLTANKVSKIFFDGVRDGDGRLIPSPSWE